MASYLEAYGEAEQKRAKFWKVLKWSAGAVAGLALAGYVLFSIFQNYSEEQRVKAFLERLQAKDYTTAYRMWGCTDTTPCRDYSFQRFMDDWGPASPHANAAAANVGSGDTCGTGVLVPVGFKGSEEVPLWVERSSKVIGFSPDHECHKRRWHFREFFRSIFNKQALMVP